MMKHENVALAVILSLVLAFGLALGAGAMVAWHLWEDHAYYHQVVVPLTQEIVRQSQAQQATQPKPPASTPTTTADQLKKSDDAKK